MITLEEAKLQLNIPSSNTTHDVELQAFVDAAIETVGRFTGRAGLVRTVTGERHHVGHAWKLWLFQRPVQSVTSVARVDGTRTWNVADLDVDIDSGLLRVVDGPAFSGLLQIDYEAGYVNVPDRFNLAARIIVQHLWQTQRGAVAGGDVRPIMEGSFDNRLNLGRGYAIPNAALELLGEPEPVLG